VTKTGLDGCALCAGPTPWVLLLLYFSQGRHAGAGVCCPAKCCWAVLRLLHAVGGVTCCVNPSATAPNNSPAEGAHLAKIAYCDGQPITSNLETADALGQCKRYVFMSNSDSQHAAIACCLLEFVRTCVWIDHVRTTRRSSNSQHAQNKAVVTANVAAKPDCV
jgi:hypothetical protein